MTALWCFQSVLALLSARPLNMATALVKRWVEAHGSPGVSEIGCRGCTVYPALHVLAHPIEAVVFATVDERLFAVCTAPSCAAIVTVPAFARLPSTPLDAIAAADERFRCAAHRPARQRMEAA